MLCENCGIREAAFKFVEVVNGSKVEHNFCAECLRDLSIEAMSMMMDESNPIGQIVAGMMGAVQQPQAPEAEAPKELENVRCPRCGTSYKEFVETSRFGCASCYDVFGPLMKDTVKTVQSGERHTGKHPAYGWALSSGETSAVRSQAGLSLKEQIRLLENQLTDAVEAEDFESAVKYRDEINALKAQLEAEKGTGITEESGI